MNNYSKFEAFHRQEILLKNTSLDKLDSELKDTKNKFKRLMKLKREDISSFE